MFTVNWVAYLSIAIWKTIWFQGFLWCAGLIAGVILPFATKLKLLVLQLVVGIVPNSITCHVNALQQLRLLFTYL